ncbi:hypothetical protein Q3G72_027448 [Acer saccharum]|nr:hypothetical protein Q3G72_027448 [Acer saccharum]
MRFGVSGTTTQLCCCNSELAPPPCVGAKANKKSNLKIAAKPSSLVKSHGMKTRKDNNLLAQSGGDLGGVKSRKELPKGRWNLEEEVTKVLDKREVSGCNNDFPKALDQAVVIGDNGSNKVGT